MPHATEHMRDRARQLRRSATVSERRLWSWLRKRSFAGYKFRRQVPMCGYILDFYCADLRLAIEVDGKQHENADGAIYDGRRSARLRRAGVAVVRVRNVDLAMDPLTVQEQVRWAIDLRTKTLPDSFW